MWYPEAAKFFYIDTLTMAIISLVGFISVVVWSFSQNYMQGDRYKARFLRRIIALSISVSVMIAANNIIIYLLAFVVSNFLLLQLMLHKREWKAAKFSALITSKYLITSFIFLCAGFFLLYTQSGCMQIQELINTSPQNSTLNLIGLLLILTGVILQSAQWPFHRWLLSSVNSPTPVSAIMHAGIINGGGYLLIRLAPLYGQHSSLLNIMFIVGLSSALIGTLLKLVQNDYKRMLASSTLAQMGFMIMQCGLGLFSAAIAHICWHGLFKAYLFLVSGSAAQDTSKLQNVNVKFSTFSLSLIIGGVLGTYIFCKAAATDWLVVDNSLFLKGVVFIAATQFCLTILSSATFVNLCMAFVLTILVSWVYGSTVGIFHHLIGELNLDLHQGLNSMHIYGFGLMLLAWLTMTFRRSIWGLARFDFLRSKAYVMALNSCQPHPSTVTASRGVYKY